MNLTLGSHEQEQLAATISTFVSPLDHPTVDDWRSASNRAASELLGADCASFMLPTENGAYLYSDEWPPEVPNAYPDLVAPLDQKYQFWRRQLAAGAWSRKQIFNSAMYRSAYYNEFVVPVRAFDAVGITIAGDANGGLAGLLFHHNRPSGKRFGRRGLQLLHIMKAAFVSGVRIQLAVGAARRSLARSVDDVVQATLLVDSLGRLLHANPSARRLLNTPAGPALQVTAEAAVRTELLSPGLSRAMSPRPTRTVTIDGRRFTMHLGFAGVELGALKAAAIVTLTDADASLSPMSAPAVSLVAKALDLTPQEARVALLLRERRSNAEIAAALSISRHTARHHTERVLAKLGVRSRAAVAGYVNRVAVSQGV